MRNNPGQYRIAFKFKVIVAHFIEYLVVVMSRRENISGYFLTINLIPYPIINLQNF